MENIPTVRFDPGEIIFKENDVSNSVYLIISGNVQIYREIYNKKIVLAEQGANTIFGEMSLIDGKPRSASVLAVETTFCYRCSATSILQKIKKVDREIYITMQNCAAIIRKNNDNKFAGNTKNVEIITDEDAKEPYMTKEEIVENEELQKKVRQLGPFMQGMFRMLVQTAYDK